MLHRTFLSLMLVSMLFLSIVTACSSPNSSAPDAAMDASQPTFAEQEANGIHGWLSSASGAPAVGSATVDAYFVGDDGQPIADAAVTFDIDMTNMSHGKTLAPTTATGDGHYIGDIHFMMPGPWRIIAMIERPDQAPVQLRFDFQVQPD